MGMGLTISASIIERHCGKLSARRREPYGTVFAFALPLAGQKSSYSAGWLWVRRSTALTSSATERTCIFPSRGGGAPSP
jgi:hypothetical protein